MVGDEALDATSGASITQIDRGLTGCHGVASTSVPGDDRYVLTTFGGPGDHQSMSCGGYADGTTWYAASRQRYGCGSKLQIEANGACVVVEALDYGPDVCVENAAGRAIIDASPLVGRALFGEAGVGYSDQKIVTVTEVAEATPVGPCGAAPTGGGGSGGGGATGSCYSPTLGIDVEAGTCVQAQSNGTWYQCNGQAWVSPVDTATRTGALGACSAWYPL
jgi:hypothetical protein